MLKGLLKQLLKLVNNLLSQIKAIYKKHKMLSLALGAFLLYYVLNNVEGFATEMNTEAKPGGTETNVLKDHDTNCNGQAMSNFHLSRDGDNISYKYNCESNLGTYENMDKNTESIPWPVTLSDNIPCYISRELRECIYITPHGVLLT